MGQKVNPIGLRLGINKTWASKWYEEKRYADFLHEDLTIKKFLQKELVHAGVAKIEIERAVDQVRINVYTAKPGIVIGKKGAEVDRIKTALQSITKQQIYINILEVKNPDLSSQLIAEGIALQLTKRVAFRRAMKRAVQNALRAGAKGIRVECSGRLGGAEMARREWYLEGRVPLHTLRADIDYGFTSATSTYGAIGVKVWVFKGEIGSKDDRSAPPGVMGGKEAYKAPRPGEREKEADRRRPKRGRRIRAENR
ncbi:30S ribosomal protein S3 [bacterium]|nr:30S ribosomal protein S3 [candidate division CSSED10-310 bacterium]